MKQRTEEWMAARAGKITASRIKDLLAVTRSGPSASRAAMIATLAVERITGQCVETYSNAAMERGVELEEEARQAYEAHVGILVEETGSVQHPEHAFIAASPDGLVGKDGLVEIKCPANMSKHVDALRTGAHAVEYAKQVQCQLACTNRQWCDVVSYDPRFPPGLRLAVTHVERDDKAITAMLAECVKADAEISELVSQLLAMEKAA